MSTIPQQQLATKPKNDIQALLASDEFKQKVALALPRHCTPDRFIRIACNALLRQPKLMQCSQTSLMKALLDLSAFGLEPDGRRAHLIPFKDEVTLIIDYKGPAELVRRSGDVSYIHADVVCENDEFDYHFGTGATLSHKPKLNDRGDVYAAYSFVRLKDGSEDFDVMDMQEIERIKQRSAAVKSGKKDTPWVTDENEMRKKTVFRRHSKWLPLSPEVKSAIEYDDELPSLQTGIFDGAGSKDVEELIELKGIVEDALQDGESGAATSNGRKLWTLDATLGARRA